ncbi:spermatogenesis-associated serine-rich protein 2-like [Passer domesticus]|uniref:spermatogenesis-associated serine-rich protein 2-like n=1 Tax=Passer domesticus TaxID=48849 RepID=UPI0030FED3B5
MSRKQQPKAPPALPSDARCGAGRARGAPESIRDKVQAVRAVVPNRSNTEIVLVLQHFDNAVDRAVQAFMEGNASEVLKEWTVTGKKKNKKKKPKAPASARPLPPGPGAAGKSWKSWKSWEIWEIWEIREIRELPSMVSTATAPPAWSHCLRPGRRRGGPSLERSLKDLQRCSVALARFRALLRDEVESSLRRVRGAFGEIQSCLMDREVALLAEMDKVKAEAMDLLSLRQRHAGIPVDLLSLRQRRAGIPVDLLSLRQRRWSCCPCGSGAPRRCAL